MTPNQRLTQDVASMIEERKAAAAAARASVEALRGTPGAANAATTAAQGAGAVAPDIVTPQAGQSAKPGIVERAANRFGFTRAAGAPPAAPAPTPAPKPSLMRGAFTQPVTMNQISGTAKNVAGKAGNFIRTPGVMNAAAGGIPMLAAAVGTAADDTDDRYSQRFGGVFDYDNSSGSLTNALKYGAQRTLGWAGDVAKMVTPDAILKHVAPALIEGQGAAPAPAAAPPKAGVNGENSFDNGSMAKVMAATPAVQNQSVQAPVQRFTTDPSKFATDGGPAIGKFAPARTQAEREARDTAFMNAVMAGEARRNAPQQGGMPSGAPAGDDPYSQLYQRASSMVKDHKYDPRLTMGNYDLNHVAQAMVNKRRGELFEKLLGAETEMGKSHSSLEMKRMELGMKGSEDVQKMLQGMATMNGVDKEGKPTTTIDHAKIEDFVNELHARDGQMRKQFGYGAADVMKSPDMARQAFADYERNVLKTRKAMGGVTENSLLRSDPENIGDITQTVIRPSRMSDSWTNGVMTGGDGKTLPTHNAIGFWRSMYDKANPFGRPEDNLTVEATTSEGHRKLMKYRDLVDQDAVLANQLRSMQKKEAK